MTLNGGKTVPVTEWLDAELQPENIKENLRYSYLFRSAQVAKKALSLIIVQAH